jgi:membrane protein implicated in regulation of membrane protease activity
VLVTVVALGVRTVRRANRPPLADPASLIGSLGTVVRPIPDEGAGTVTLVMDGQRVRIDAVADAPVRAGATVIVLDTDSPTAVVVAESGF